MRRSTASKPARPDGPLASAFDPSAAFRFQSLLVRNGSDTQAHGFDRMVRMGQEYLAFVSHRLDRDRTLMSDLAAADGPADIAGVWNAFLQTAQQEYAEETQRLMSQWLDGARDAAADVQHQFDDAQTVAGSATDAAARHSAGKAAGAAARADASAN
ncbi:phasin family protein [Albimonas pacifica]|uniref:Phasin protein n=1 Tax=Albimonas pacifica TaxID=1114924 RepID=A0A1I3IYQ4_9RHOB|nr:phasin family protein [Albimonas pacifica]SFI52956.1 Phasin protein [Albimonas pacifica]